MAFDLSKLAIPPLPTLANLNATVPDTLDIEDTALKWLNSLAIAIESNVTEDLRRLFLHDSWWRDMLALTWDFRTFHGVSPITLFLRECICSMCPRNFKLRREFLELQRPYEDLAWIHAFFDFETDVGLCLGIFRLVPTTNGEWKAHTVFTNLEELKGFPEKMGDLRDITSNRDPCNEFTNGGPTVLVIGAGQSGLNVAARLKSLGVSTLVIERNEHIGDNWRNRYEALCLHDPVWYDHMPYLPFPPTWPTYTPAGKLANWMESYADILDFDVWTSSIVTQAIQDSNTKQWEVTVKNKDGDERIFTANHIVFATGLCGEKPNIPRIPGTGKFKGHILHSTQHKRATDHAGKKVVIIGACSSANDIAQDYYNHGIDVTIYQRSSTYVMTTKNGWDVMFTGLYSENAPPTDIADRMDASFPHFMAIELSQRCTRQIAELDKELLDALNARGFKTNLGIYDTGVLMLEEEKAGGYYLDAGASRLIADGKIKVKSGSQIKEFTEAGLLFEDGSELAADVVLFATGLGSAKDHIRKICGDNVAQRCHKIWGFNQEGEISGVWRELGVPGLWYMAGNMALCRFHSKHMALQIKAMEENIFGPRCSIPAPIPNKRVSELKL